MVLVRPLKTLSFSSAKPMHHLDKILKCDLSFEDSDINTAWATSYYGHTACRSNSSIGIEFRTKYFTFIGIERNQRIKYDSWSMQ